MLNHFYEWRKVLKRSQEGRKGESNKKSISYF